MNGLRLGGAGASRITKWLGADLLKIQILCLMRVSNTTATQTLRQLRVQENNLSPSFSQTEMWRLLWFTASG